MNKRKPTNKIDRKRALIYCRVSSDRQMNEGHGLDSQEQRCIKYAQEEKNLSVAKVFRDEGVSGSLFERPAMRDLISFLDANPKEKFVVIFDDLKRFARDIEIHLQLKGELVKKREVQLLCPNFNFEDNPTGRALENIVAVIAGLEREQNREQVIQKQKARLESGYWPFCPPPALKFIKDPVHGKILSPDGDFTEIFKQAIEKYRDYEFNTLHEVQSFILMQYKLKSIKRPLSLHGVTKILSCPLYAGYIEYKPWGVSLREGHHQGFISYETYLAVQEKMANKAKPRLRKDYSDDFPLRNYIICPKCQRPVTASWHKGRHGTLYAHYWCKTDGCEYKNKTVLREKIHEQFSEILKQFRPQNRVVHLTLAIFQELWQEKQKGVKQESAALKKELRDTESGMTSLVERISKATSENVVKQYEAEIEKLSNKKTALEAELSKERYAEDQFDVAFKTVFGYLANPLKAWESPDYNEKRLLLGMYFERGIAYDRNSGFGTPDLPLIVKLITQKHLSKSHLVEMPGVKPGSKTNSSSHCSQD